MSRLLNALRRHGPAQLARLVVGRGRSLIYRRRALIIYRAPLEAIRRMPPKLDEGWNYTCEELTIEQARAFRDAPADVISLLGKYVEEDVPEERLLLVRINGEVAGWIMVFVGECEWPLTETATVLPLTRTDSVWISAYTRPEFRGRHLHRTLLGESANNATARGATHVWAWHEHWNEVPGKNMELVGMRRVGMHERTSILGLGLPARITVISES